MDIEPLVRRIEQEFHEMPGLRLTPAQAGRLWGVDDRMCGVIIDRLVASTFLRWTTNGAIMRAVG
jgi:hypothetical protein